MLCPDGHGPMTRGQRFWICEECGQRLPLGDTAGAASAANLAGLARLPSVVALPLREYAETAHPVLRLHRLCDAVEILTRFCAIVALGELRALRGEQALPDELLRELQPSIERPTFGKWKGMLDVLLCHLPAAAPLVVPELPAFVSTRLGPCLLGGQDQPPERCLLTLRNLLAHGGAMTRSRAEYFLHGEATGSVLESARFTGWGAWLEDVAGHLAFLAGAEVCFHHDNQTCRLAGPHAEAEPVELAADLRLALRPLEGHVVLLRGGRWLDLWPLCDYGRAEASSLRGPLRADRDSPLVYIRGDRRRLHYAALGVDVPHGERADVVSGFRALFRLDDRQPDAPAAAHDFEDEVHQDAAALVGRAAEVGRAKEAIKAMQAGVLWVGGQGGLGKSFLMAKLADDLRGDARKVCRIVWRFKVSDGARCSRSAFFRHAVERLANWPPLARRAEDVSPPREPERDPNRLYNQLEALLNEAAALTADDVRGRPPRVLFFLDGLDEIERLDPDFVQVPLRLARPNVVWVCAGRPEGRLPEVYAPASCTHVFSGGLPPMSNDDVRAMLVDGTGALKYALLALDDERASGPKPINAAVQAVVERARGLTLYVHFVVEDVLAGHFRFSELPQKLPPALDAYYADLLNRMAMGDLHALLTPMVVTVAWAREPLEEETLHLLMERRKVLRVGPEGRELLRQGLARVQSLLRLVPLPGGRTGYEPYHPTFREYVQQNRSGQLGQQNGLARDEFCALVLDWAQLPVDHPGRRYALRFGPQHLLEAGRAEVAAGLLLDLFFLEAKAEAGLIFDLTVDFRDTLSALPPNHLACRTLRLIAESLHIDAQFLARRPAMVFQCLWNRCWWHDCPEAGRHQDPSLLFRGEEGIKLGQEVGLHRLAERWHAEKRGRDPHFVWVRSLRPPFAQLSAARLVSMNMGGWVNEAVFSPDGRTVAAVSKGGSLILLLADTGEELLRCEYSSWEEGSHDMLNLAFAPDGRRILCLVQHYNGKPEEHKEQIKAHDVLDGGLCWAVSCPGATSVAINAARGELLVTAGSRLVCLDVRTGETVREFPCREGEILRAAPVPNHGPLVVVTGERLQIWEPDTGTVVGGWDLPAGLVDLAVAHDGRAVATTHADGFARLWELPGGRQRMGTSFGPHGVTAVACSPDGALLAIGVGESEIYPGHSVRLCDGATGRQLACLTGFGSVVASLAFSPDGSRLVSGCQDKTVCTWDVSFRGVTKVLVDHGDWIRDLQVSPEGRLVATGADDGAVRLWTADGVPDREIRTGDRRVQRVGFSPTGEHLVSQSMYDPIYRVWEVGSGKQVTWLDLREKELAEHPAAGDDPSPPERPRPYLSYRGRRIAFLSQGAVEVWNPYSGQRYLAAGLPPAEEDGRGERVGFSEDGRTLYLRRGKHLLSWDPRTGQPREVGSGEVIQWVGPEPPAVPSAWSVNDSWGTGDTAVHRAGEETPAAWVPEQIGFTRFLSTATCIAVDRGIQRHLLFLAIEDGTRSISDHLEAPAATEPTNAEDDPFADTADEEGMPDLRYCYMQAKAKMYLKRGPEIYRQQDFFHLPEADWEPERLERIEALMWQMLHGRGGTAEAPFHDVSLEVVCDMTAVFHFHFLSHWLLPQEAAPFVEAIRLQHCVRGEEALLFRELAGETEGVEGMPTSPAG